MRIETPSTNLKETREAATRATVRAVATTSRSYREVARRLGVSVPRARALCREHGPGLTELIELEEAIRELDAFEGAHAMASDERQVA